MCEGRLHKEGTEQMLDVIVVGAGPAGSAAAKRCAEYGLKTLMLEQYSLPRDKVCSGMVMGPVAHTLIKQEFGDIPKNVLSRPYYLSGYMYHVPGIGSQKEHNYTLLAWRRDLDYWMNKKAEAKGAEIWQRARVIALKHKGQGFLVEIEKDKRRQELETRFVVGADGVNSIVRKFLFPELKVRYEASYQEHYQGELALDKKYFHWFCPIQYGSYHFAVHHHGDLVVLDYENRAGQIRESREWFRKFLSENYGFNVSQKPVWRGGCLEPDMYEELISHNFLPARGNALLVGDAAGFILPISGEGIGTGIKSGLSAADSILKAIEAREPPDRIYLGEIEGMLSVFKEICLWPKRITDEVKGGGHSLPKVLRDAFRSTLRTF